MKRRRLEAPDGRSEVITRSVVIQNSLGIHARPAALLVQEAGRFQAVIYLSKGDVKRINAKSIMGVMMLAAERGAEVTVETDGVDEQEALDALTELLARNFEDQI